ncbi:cupin domain-containing protein [Luteimonas sp. MC1825]|uniref:cupin domain-containing protein n=1 Tax=Luteimonas sp. MC1825 TaxID=2761107 RepID=UPI0016189CD6|nr:cupin domain-containing protein [Luteimonas sp. MC1825]MBB6598233.1 cupin domain-containing protein [Luteimonas sp. MC1825]QOC88452.1 cupin domain-containing protein [Luteimonas sp. MC1825]
MKMLTLVLVAIPFATYGHDDKRHGESNPTSTDPSSDYVVKLEEMTIIEAGKGEKIHLLKGNEHGFKGLSFILTETSPGGGPPLHTHESEEAHVLTSGTMSYVIGDETFVVSAPYILRVPANTPHTFINAGSTPLSLTAVFDSANYTFKPVAANPLQTAESSTP